LIDVPAPDHPHVSQAVTKQAPAMEIIGFQPVIESEPSPSPSPPPHRAVSVPPKLEHKDLLRHIIAAFKVEAPRVRKTLGYRLGIVFVTLVMLLLPLVYVAIICGCGYFLFWHATQNLATFAATHSFLAVIFGYVAPLFAGVILILFMIKPLFARSPRAGLGRELEHSREPILFALVGCIARAVGAPEPRRIVVDCEVNASASFGRGPVGLLGNQLVLTIGLPLVVGLNARQFAGVLAHELGHFAQGAGMRFSYVVRSINHWFMRLACERDAWDEALVQWSEESGRLALIFYLTRFCVWLTRCLLWLLMMLGHTVSCFLLRQMEYDADRYEARVAGSASFEETSRQMALLDVAGEFTLAHAGNWWVKDSYPNDLPSLIAASVEQIPEELANLIRKSMNKARTGLFDTHPCFKDRIANARREDSEGLFRMDQPATILCSDYPKMARGASLDFYRQVFGKRVKKADLKPVA
jgi:Zn-dependent protease with chaperone function